MKSHSTETPRSQFKSDFMYLAIVLYKVYVIILLLKLQSILISIVQKYRVKDMNGV